MPILAKNSFMKPRKGEVRLLASASDAGRKGLRIPQPNTDR